MDGLHRCSRPCLMFELITENDSSPVWCWDEPFLLSPWGLPVFFFFFPYLSPSWTSLQDAKSILWKQKNATCSGPSAETLCNFAVMRLEVIQWLSPKLMNLSLSVEKTFCTSKRHCMETLLYSSESFYEWSCSAVFFCFFFSSDVW